MLSNFFFSSAIGSQINSSLKCLFKSFYHFIIGWFMFLLLIFRDSTCILDTSPLSDICKCILPLPFILFVVSSDEQKLSTFVTSDLSVFFVFISLCDFSAKHIKICFVVQHMLCFSEVSRASLSLPHSLSPLLERQLYVYSFSHVILSECLTWLCPLV